MPVGEFESLSRIRFLGKKSRALAVESLTLSAHTETHTDTLAQAVWLQRISDAFQFQRPQSHLHALTSRDLAWLQGMPRTWRPQPQAGHHGAGVVAHTMEAVRAVAAAPHLRRSSSPSQVACTLVVVGVLAVADAPPSRRSGSPSQAVARTLAVVGRRSHCRFRPRSRSRSLDAWEGGREEGEAQDERENPRASESLGSNTHCHLSTSTSESASSSV